MLVGGLVGWLVDWLVGWLVHCVVVGGVVVVVVVVLLSVRYLNYESFVFKGEIEATWNTRLGVPGIVSNDPVHWLDSWQADPSFEGLFTYELGAANTTSGWGSSAGSTSGGCRVQFNRQSSFLVGPLQFQVRKFPRSLNCSGARDSRWFLQVCSSVGYRSVGWPVGWFVGCGRVGIGTGRVCCTNCPAHTSVVGCGPVLTPPVSPASPTAATTTTTTTTTGQLSCC